MVNWNKNLLDEQILFILENQKDLINKPADLAKVFNHQYRQNGECVPALSIKNGIYNMRNKWRQTRNSKNSSGYGTNGKKTLEGMCWL